MVERMTFKSVEFAMPFMFAGIDALQPAGIYEIQTVEEQIDGLSFIAYRRLSTTITLHPNNKSMQVRQFTVIDPADLAAALERDARASPRNSKG